MKARTAAITFLALLSIGIAFASLLAPTTAQKKVNVSFNPRSWEYDGTPPSPHWTAVIWRVDPGLIDPGSVELTGETGGRTIYPVAYEVSYPKRDDFFAYFDSNDMKNLITDLLILHSVYGVPGKYRLFLQISGELTDGTSFYGIKPLTVSVPNPPS